MHEGPHKFMIMMEQTLDGGLTIQPLMILVTLHVETFRIDLLPLDFSVDDASSSKPKLQLGAMTWAEALP